MNKDWVHIIADITTICSLIVAIYIYLHQTQQQQEMEINQVIHEIDSAKHEISLNIALMNLLKNTNLTEKSFFIQFDIDNLRIISTDGRILNHSVKFETIARVMDLTQYNNRILYINSPQFSPLVFNDTNSIHTIQLYQNQTVDSILKEEEILQNGTIPLLNGYQICLQQQRNFEACQ